MRSHKISEYLGDVLVDPSSLRPFPLSPISVHTVVMVIKAEYCLDIVSQKDHCCDETLGHRSE